MAQLSTNDSRYFLGKSINYRLENDLSEEKRSSEEKRDSLNRKNQSPYGLWDSRRSVLRFCIVFRAINYRKIIRKKNLDPASAIGGDARRPRRKGGGAKVSRRRDPSRWAWLERTGRRAVSPRFWRHGGTARTHNPQLQFGRWAVRTSHRSVQSPDYSLRKCDSASAAEREASAASRAVLDFQAEVSTIRVSIVRETYRTFLSARPDGNLGALCCCDVPKLSDPFSRLRDIAYPSVSESATTGVLPHPPGTRMYSLARIPFGEACNFKLRPAGAY